MAFPPLSPISWGKSCTAWLSQQPELLSSTSSVLSPYSEPPTLPVPNWRLFSWLSLWYFYRLLLTAFFLHLFSDCHFVCDYVCSFSNAKLVDFRCTARLYKCHRSTKKIFLFLTGRKRVFFSAVLLLLLQPRCANWNSIVKETNH